jgi:hypothetical protein
MQSELQKLSNQMVPQDKSNPSLLDNKSELQKLTSSMQHNKQINPTGQYTPHTPHTPHIPHAPTYAHNTQYTPNASNAPTMYNSSNQLRTNSIIPRRFNNIITSHRVILLLAYITIFIIFLDIVQNESMWGDNHNFILFISCLSIFIPIIFFFIPTNISYNLIIGFYFTSIFTILLLSYLHKSQNLNKKNNIINTKRVMILKLFAMFSFGYIIASILSEIPKSNH